jgi:hypothetical protein
MIILVPNIDTAYLWASQLFQTTILPSYLEDVIEQILLTK